MKMTLRLLCESLFLTATVALSSLPNSQAAPNTFYGVGKTQSYQQTDEATISLAARNPYSFRAFIIPAAAAQITVAVVEAPESDDVLLLQSVNGQFSLVRGFTSQTELDEAFPEGLYSLVMVSGAPVFEGPAEFQFDATDFPEIPQISNYSAAQAVDATQDFALNWNEFADASGNDYIRLTITDNAGAVVFGTGLPGEANMLPRSAQSVTIPANQLQAGTYNATLSFVRVFAEDDSSYSGALGTAAFATETTFTLKAVGGGGPDTTAPAFLSATPANGATDVPLNSRVLFSFNEAMAADHAITWSANVTPADFSYSWSADQRTLTASYDGTFPPNSTITWALSASAFKDLAGNPLSSGNLNGSFVTGTTTSNPNDPCDPDFENDGTGAFSMLKTVYYIQTGSAAPVLDPDTGAFFSASLASPTNNPVSEATLTLPDGSTKPLSSFFGSSFMLFDEFESEAAMNAAYPSGSYTLSVKRASGSGSVTLSISATPPPIPQVSNLAETENFDATEDFALQWNAFTGVTPIDSLYVELHDSLGTNFYAPEPCIPRPLPNTATSIVVPGMTFASGSLIQGSLSFSKSGGFDTNSIPDIPAFAGYSKITEFDFLNVGPQPDAPTIENLVRQKDGVVRFDVRSRAGAVVLVEASENLEEWLPVTTSVSASGVLEVTDPAAESLSKRFYRVSTF